MEKFAKLTEEIKKCDKCPLRAGCTQVVPGDGSPQAELMFVGEGPGEKEDQQGIPFCGAAGKFLDELLSSINLPRQQVYITNIVKCRPPGNRDPQEDEINICKDWLEKQIEEMKPKIIATLGRYSMNFFLPDFKISQCHGQIFRSKTGRIYLPLYHPAVALYNGSMREVLKKDFRKIPKILKQV